MSGTSGVGGEYSGLSLVDLFPDVQKESNSILNTSTTAARAEGLLSGTLQSGTRARNAYSISATSGVGQAALKKALSEMGASGGQVTFKDIAAYQQQLQTRFTSDLRIDLYKKGVDLETEFTLNMTAEGKIEVLCDDPQARQTIQRYFEGNSDVCGQFGYIQALANLDRARQSPAGAANLMGSVLQSKKAIQVQAVEAFFDSALSSGMSYGSLMATFTAGNADSGETGSASFYAGISYTV